MSIRIVRLGSPRAPDEGIRIGTVRRPPRGVPRRDFARLDYYDVWLPALAPSEPLRKSALSAQTAAEWSRFVTLYRAEMNRPDPSRLLDLLAALSHGADSRWDATARTSGAAIARCCATSLRSGRPRSGKRMDARLAYLHLALRAVLLLFPAIALLALRRAGPRALAWTTAAAAGAIGLFAVAAASERFGNRLVATHGHGPILLQILFVFGLTYLLPIAATAVTIRLLERSRLGDILDRKSVV